MIHFGTQLLTTERLILRRYEPEDAEDMFRNWASDPEVTKFLSWQPYTGIDEVKEHLAKIIPGYEDRSTYRWTIVLKETDEPIGDISVVGWNEPIEMSRLGYCLGSDWWHQGLMTEAVQEVIRYLFTWVQVKRIEAWHNVNNPHSGAVMKKCGMSYEGTLRNIGMDNTGLHDECVYSILDTDYYKNMENIWRK